MANDKNLCNFTNTPKITYSKDLKDITFEANSSQLSLDRSKLTIAPFDVEALLAEDAHDAATKATPFRFGNPIEVNLTPDNSGQWTTDPQGNRTWSLEIESPDAYSMNLFLDYFHIPVGASLQIFDGDHQDLFEYTHEDHNSDHKLSTWPLSGDTLLVEYYEPSEVAGRGTLEIGSVIHGYQATFSKEERDYGDSGSCNNNVNCSQWNDLWEEEENASALILTSGGFRLCSGSLINNVEQDGTPYFLTANHCLGGESNWGFMFEYESPGCANEDGPTEFTVSGATLLVSHANSDVALLLLDQNPLDTHDNITLAGFDASGTTPQQPVAIHHPSGDIKKISFDYDNALSNGNFWRILDWDDGTTEPGSSGSPLFDDDHHIVGQLYGGYAACGNNEWDEYGKLSTSWNLGLSDYLDPSNTGVWIVDTYNSGFGCTNEFACNYNPDATEDNGSCEYVVDDCNVCGGNNLSCSGCTDLQACNYDETAIILDESQCAYAPAGCECNSSIQHLNLTHQAALLTGSNYEQVHTFEGSGLLTSIEVDLMFDNIYNDESWAADFILVISSSNSCIEIGGYDLNYGHNCVSVASWPSSWNTASDGTYSTTIDLSEHNLSSDGSSDWEIIFMNGWNASSGASFEADITWYGLCDAGTPSLTGDLNADGYINVQDIVLLTNYILANQCPDTSDINNDGACNVLDIVLIVNIILETRDNDDSSLDDDIY